METSQRQTYLDWLRILSIVGVLFFHSAMPYVAEDWWHIKNRETSNLMMESNYFLHLFRMPLLFLYIGDSKRLDDAIRQSSLNFIGLRLRRLLYPAACRRACLLSPPQIYMERLNNGCFVPVCLLAIL